VGEKGIINHRSTQIKMMGLIKTTGWQGSKVVGFIKAKNHQAGSRVSNTFQFPDS
jgi:hypothetical protein